MFLQIWELPFQIGLHTTWINEVLSWLLMTQMHVHHHNDTNEALSPRYALTHNENVTGKRLSPHGYDTIAFRMINNNDINKIHYEWYNKHHYPASKVHGAGMGPFAPRSAPCWPHEPCYQGSYEPCELTHIDNNVHTTLKFSANHRNSFCEQMLEHGYGNTFIIRWVM